MGYERGLFLGSAIRVLDRPSLRLSTTPRGVVEGRFDRTVSRRSMIDLRRGSALRGFERVTGGGELRLGGDASRFGEELRLGGEALRFGGELRLGGEALRLGDELRLGGDALRFGGELRLDGDALRFGGELRLGGDALRLGDELGFGGEALRLEPDRDLLVPLLLLRSLPPPSIEAERCVADTPLSLKIDPFAAGAGPAAIQNAIHVATAMVVTSLGQEKSCADIALPPAQGSPVHAVWSPRAVAP